MILAFACFYSSVFSSSSSLTFFIIFFVSHRNFIPLSRCRSASVFQFVQSSSTLRMPKHHAFFIMFLVCCFTVLFNLTKRHYLLQFIFIEKTKKIKNCLNVTENTPAYIIKIIGWMKSRCSHSLTTSLILTFHFMFSRKTIRENSSSSSNIIARLSNDYHTCLQVLNFWKQCP